MASFYTMGGNNYGGHKSKTDKVQMSHEDKCLTKAKQGNTVKFDVKFFTLGRLFHRIKTDLVGSVKLKGKEAYLFVGETRVKLE